MCVQVARCELRGARCELRGARCVGARCEGASASASVLIDEAPHIKKKPKIYLFSSPVEFRWYSWVMGSKSLKMTKKICTEMVVKK